MQRIMSNTCNVNIIYKGIMVEIYRVENKNGRGCYSWKTVEGIAKFLGEDWRTDHCDRRPTPDNDYGIERMMFAREVCGWKDIRQALKWFSAKEFRVFKRFGYNLKKVTVQNITEVGECQILAIR